MSQLIPLDQPRRDALVQRAHELAPLLRRDGGLVAVEDLANELVELRRRRLLPRDKSLAQLRQCVDRRALRLQGVGTGELSERWQ